MRKAFVCVVAIALISLSSLASGESSKLKEVASGLMCPCGCEAMILETCICGPGLTIKADIKSKIESGQSRGQIEAHLISMYGKKILAAPTKRGFDRLAWILPFAGAFAMGAFVIYSITSRLKKKEEMTEALEVAVDPELKKYIEKIEKELKEYK